MLLLCLFASLWLGSEVRYGMRVRPEGVRNIAKHLRRFGPPALIYRIQREDGVFFYLAGDLSHDRPLVCAAVRPSRLR